MAEIEDAPEIRAADATIHAFRRNVFVAASAGTGKTYRLTALYVLLDLGMTSMGQRDARTAAPPVGPERIVATTFSRAAAAEIATRVEAALRQIAAWDGRSTLPFDRVLAARAEALGRRLDRGELRTRANDALSRWSAARIDTLHGVARRVVQSNALAIGMAPGTRVLDEEEALALSDLAVDEALSAALSDGGERAEAARALIVSSGGVGPTRFRVQRLLDRLDEEGLAPAELARADHLADARALAAELLALARRLAAQGSTALREPAAAIASALARTPEGRLLPRDAIAPIADVLTRRLPPRAKRTPADDELDDFVGNLPGKTKSERAAGLLALLTHAPDLGAREQGMIAVIEDARDRFAAGKRRAGGLGFGDLLRIARDTLRDEPEIARDVREEIDALLVDEFQDTSRVQRDLVYLLREREDAAAARAPGVAPRASGLTGHGLFLVGDRKQSIYGFRGADVSVFSRVAAELAGAAAATALSLPLEDALHLGGEPLADFVALRESRRSGPAILSFVNAFSARDFASATTAGAPLRPFEIAYGPGERLVPAAADGGKNGAGRVVFVADDGTSPEDAEPMVREATGASREAQIAASLVARITHGAPPDARFAYRDVAILARRRSTIPLVEVALGRLDIPYVVAGRALYDTPEVRDVAALLRLLLDPRDRFALAVVLRGPMVALTDGALALLSPPGRGLTVPLLGRWPSSGGHGPSSLAAPERARLEAFRGRFASIRRASLRLAPAEAIRAAMQAFDLDRVLAALPRAEARIGNLDRLVSIARRRGGTLAAFVRWLERRMRDEADEAEAAVFSAEDDAVRLTTIHASKGLDFPAVVLVDANAEPRVDAGGVGFVTEGDRALFAVRHFASKPRTSVVASPDDRALVALATATNRSALVEARAREQAERRRLTYVAITRARRLLAIVGTATPPRPSAALATLNALVAEPVTMGNPAGGAQTPPGAALVEVQHARDVLAEARPAPPRLVTRQVGGVPRRPPRSTSKAVAVDVEALALFLECPRRYRLRRVLGIAEERDPPQLDLFAPPAPRASASSGLPRPVASDASLDPRPLHRAPVRALARWPGIVADGVELEAALEAALVVEGLAAGDVETRRLALAAAGFARGTLEPAVAAGAALFWDEPFVARIDGSGPSLLVRGVTDLCIERAGGVDLVAIGLQPSTDASAVDLGLRVAALAASRSFPDARVRVGTVSADAPREPRWTELGAADHDKLEADLGAAARRLADALHADRFDGIARPRCERLGCGFLAACHGA